MLVWGRCCGSSRQWLDQFAWAWKDISTLTWITDTLHILMTIHQDSLADSLGFTKLFNEVVSGHSVVIPCPKNRSSCLQESKRPFHSMWYWSCKSFKWHLLSHSAFCSLRFEDLKKLRRMTGLKPMQCASMFHVLEELFDFKLWESARGIEGKPSPHVSQPNAPMPSFLHYVFSILGSRTCWESFGNFRCRVQVTRAAIRLHTSAKSRKLCAAKIKRKYFVFLWYVDMLTWFSKPAKAIL